MSKAATEGQEDRPSREIIEVVKSNPSLVVLHKSTKEKLLQYIDGEIAKHVWDPSTEKSRGATASLAFRIVQTRTAVEKAAVALRKDIQSEKESFTAEMEKRSTAVRKPLTDWEEDQAAFAKMEQDRIAEVARVMAKIRGIGTIQYGETSDDIAHRRRVVDGLEFEVALFKDALPEAEKLKADLLVSLDASIEEAEAAEEAAAELERLREAERKRQADEKAKEDAAAPIATVERVKPAIEIISQSDVEAVEEELTPNSDFEVEPAPQDISGEMKVRDERIAEVAAAIAKAGNISKEAAGLIAYAIAYGEIPHVQITF